MEQTAKPSWLDIVNRDTAAISDNAPTYIEIQDNGTYLINHDSGQDIGGLSAEQVEAKLREWGVPIQGWH